MKCLPSCQCLACLGTPGFVVKTTKFPSGRRESFPPVGGKRRSGPRSPAMPGYLAKRCLACRAQCGPLGVHLTRSLRKRLQLELWWPRAARANGSGQSNSGRFAEGKMPQNLPGVPRQPRIYSGLGSPGNPEYILVST